ncbi:YfgM family protein [Caenimonas soli]|uniref:YfgM family protein n=1 Tax=Caenimonas soli TaxID=2735555 RepID=UPI00155253C1|nr:tetratricopeptide repeat protein [Caenimonas soli]NPC54017.1 tetratricopeptide repeat protein [Caenimonas soli]
MAKHLDLEEQEQLDEIKHFWREYGNLITWALIAVFGSIAAWNGWQYWQRTQAAQAATMYDEVERAAQAGDTARVERAFSDMKDKFGGTTYAQQAGMLAAKVLIEKGNTDAAKSALAWVADKSSDEGYQAVARLRLAGVLVQAKAYDDALKQLSGPFPKSFEALAADRRGDVYNLQGKKAEAKAEYIKAYKISDERAEYRRLIEVKLSALGVDAKGLVAAPAPAASGAKP